MKTKIIVTTIALLGFTGSAFAQGYMGVGVVGGRISVPSVSTTAFTGSGDKTSDTGFKLFGGYDFTPNWGVELAYNDFGNSYSMQGTAAGVPWSMSGQKASNWTLAGVGTLPLSKEFSLFGKLGVAWNHIDGGSSNLAGISSNSNSRTQAMFGVGASYAFTKNWSVRGEYEDYGKFTNEDVWTIGGSGAVKGQAWSLSARYSF